MLYGHVENDEDRVDHLLKLRALQDETGGFQTFIPLAFHPDNTPLAHLPKTTGILDLRQIAVSRLVLDNFPHIKAYWQMLTPKIAQIALRFGADDLDGTVVEEKIYHDAGATTPQGMHRQELIRLIQEAGREPVERDTLYRPVIRTETTVTVAV
jgi:aminodeoxyfutalosine synthase